MSGSKSTGPKTAEGKARASLNALKHGLSHAHLGLPTPSAEAVSLAQSFQTADLTQGAALQLAQAFMELRNIRRQQQLVLNLWIEQSADMVSHDGPSTYQLLEQLRKLSYYERRHFTTLKRAAQNVL